LTKSAVEGATPSTEFTAVFSPIDWAAAEVEMRATASLAEAEKACGEMLKLLTKMAS
jgi:hypothetical protein